MVTRIQHMGKAQQKRSSRAHSRSLAGGVLIALVGLHPAYAANLRVVTDPPISSGMLHAAIYAADATDWSTPLQTLKSDQPGPTFTELPAGRYAVQLFIDLNGNGTLDTSARGLPREPVGFSQNPSLLKGQPSPEGCAFELGEKNAELRVRLYQPRKPVTAQ